MTSLGHNELTDSYPHDQCIEQNFIVYVYMESIWLLSIFPDMCNEVFTYIYNRSSEYDISNISIALKV